MIYDPKEIEAKIAENNRRQEKELDEAIKLAKDRPLELLRQIVAGKFDYLSKGN